MVRRVSPTPISPIIISSLAFASVVSWFQGSLPSAVRFSLQLADAASASSSLLPLGHYIKLEHTTTLPFSAGH